MMQADCTEVQVDLSLTFYTYHKAHHTISGGCGAMYEISIEAEEFRGKRTVQQHMLVNEVWEAKKKKYSQTCLSSHLY